MQAQIQYIPGLVDYTSGRDQYGQYFINIFDDNGNPTNGNNVVVNYQETTGGTLGAVIQVTIPGLGVKIYDGLIQHNSNPYKNFALTGALVPGTPSGPTIPDVKISSVTIEQKADSSGANGIIVINATSSFLPLTYYIDGGIVPFTRFAGISAGAHTAKVIDANGNATPDFSFTVPSVSSILFKDPTKTVGGKSSRWNAAFNPVVFEYHRKDFDVTAISQDSTTLKPKLTINTNLTGLAIGDYIYLDAGVTNGLSTYKGAYKVLQITLPSIVVIDTDYVAPTTISGFANSDTLRPYYKVITKIKFVDPSTGLFKTVISTNRPRDGVTKADISSLLQSILKPGPDQSDYTQSNYRDMGLAASYQISYAETWEGNTPIYTDITTPYYALYSAAQLGQSGGGNAFDFVTQAGGTQLAKWCTDFTEPSYTYGFPFDLPFIYSENIAGRQIYSKIVLLDINRQPTGTGTVTSFLTNENASYILNQDGSKLIIARQQLVNTPIVEHVGLNRLLINSYFGPTCCFLQVQLFYDEAGVPIPVTEAIIVRVDGVCAINPVYLRWVGLNGSWNYFRFNYNQSLTLDIQNPTIIKDYVSDWENAEGIERVISKDASEKVQLYADALDMNDMRGLKSIKFSPHVQVLASNIPLKWQTIVVNSSTFNEGETINGQSEFGITFNKPSLNIQTQ